MGKILKVSLLFFFIRQQIYFKFFSDIPLSMWRLVCNPIYVVTCLGACMELMIVSGFVVFLPKYLETQFSLGKSQASVFTGKFISKSKWSFRFNLFFNFRFHCNSWSLYRNFYWRMSFEKISNPTKRSSSICTYIKSCMSCMLRFTVLLRL